MLKDKPEKHIDHTNLLVSSVLKVALVCGPRAMLSLVPAPIETL